MNLLHGTRVLLILLPASSAEPPPTLPASQPSKPVAVAAAQDGEALMGRLEEIDRRIDAIKDLSAQFEQRKFTALLKKPLESSGQVFVKADRIKWETQHPRPGTLAVSPGEIRIFDPQEKVVEIYEAQGDLRALTGSPLPRLSTLKPRFDIRPYDRSMLIQRAPSEPADEKDPLIGVEMLPKSDELKQHVASVRVVIDSRTPCLVAMEITDPDGDRTVMHLSAIKVNIGLTDAQVQLSLPKGTRESRPMSNGSGGEVRKPADANASGSKDAAGHPDTDPKKAFIQRHDSPGGAPK